MRRLGSALILVALACISGRAQTKESLQIGPGDLLHVQVYANPDMEQHARVTDSGEIPLELAGTVKVSGQTPAEAARSIEKRLLSAHILLHPQALVSVEEYATQKVSVMGEVRNPGAHAINTPRSVLDVLTLAGGLTELADRKVLIEHRGTSEKVAYFVSNSPELAADTAVLVNPGDSIIVPKAGVAYALGDVAHPGGYTMTNNDGTLSALELLARAGGSNHTAVPSHAVLIRKSQQGYENIPLQLSKMQKGKQADMQLQPNDIIFIPFSYMKNFAVSGSGIAASVGSAAVYRF
jgi:polysaccharide export outer membrane protein